VKMGEADLERQIVEMLPARRGHFRLESGHHGSLWLDLERLCLRPDPIRELAAECPLCAQGLPLSPRPP
jgi:orotate phosphoribosyltransferase